MIFYYFDLVLRNQEHSKLTHLHTYEHFFFFFDSRNLKLHKSDEICIETFTEYNISFSFGNRDVEGRSIRLCIKVKILLLFSFFKWYVVS